jgi:polyisoprenoid-binding protein YceI
VVGPARAIPRAFAATLALLAVLAPPSEADADRGRFTPVTGKSEVSFEAAHPFGGFSGRTQDVRGAFLVDPGDLRQGVTGTLGIGAATLRTGDAVRDRDMWAALAVDRYPEIRFVVERVDVSFPSVTERSDVLLTINGRLLIRGVERPFVFPGRVRRRDDGLWVRGEAQLSMSQFGITPPSRLFLRVSDTVLVRFELLLSDRH